MKTRLKRIFGVSIGAVVLLAGVIVSTFLLSSPAQGKSNSLISKAIGYQVYECYQSTVGMRSEVSMQQYDGLDSITAIGHLANLPYGYYGNLTNTTCAKLIGGVPEEGFSGAVALKGVTIPSNNKNTAAVGEFLTNMGYTEKKGDQEGLCASYTYTGSKDNSTYVITMCNTTDKDGYITGDRFQIYDKNGNSSIPYSSTIVQFEAQNRAIRLDCSSVVGYGKCEKHTFEPGDKFETFAGEILGDLQEHRASVPYGTPNAIGVRPYAWTLSGMTIEPFGDVTSSFSLGNTATAGKKAVEFLTGYGNITDLKLTNSEKLELLKDYLTDWYKVDNYGCNLDSSARNIATGAGYKPIRTNIFSGNEYQTCYIKPTAHVGLSVASYGDSGYFDGTMMGFDAIVKNIEGLTNSFIESDKQKCNEAATSARQAAQNLLDQSTTSEEYRQRAQNTIYSIKQIEDSYGQYWYESDGNIGCYKFVGLDGEIVDTEITPPTQDDDFEPPAPNDGANDLASCFSNASSLGWILCPATLLVGQATGGIYESIENDFLFFDPGMLDPEDNPGVYDAWKTIRDFANIIFAIALVVVILSQVTGIGVSNYGIKKILPSLIIVAVLVNLSFFGCQLLVDISNIFGSGLKDLFEGFRVVSDNNVSLSQISTGIANTLATGGLLFGAGAVAVNTWELWVLPLFLALLVAFISMMFFYILLAVRQALILILIIIAPLAIVCYALPNTKKMFDRWWKIFWALLVLYPICGVLVGGTKFASSLFLSMKQDSFFFNLVAVLLQVVPVFFIPTLLKGSLNALGSLGMRISNFGKRLGGNLSHTVAGADIYKDAQRQLGSSYATRKYRSIDAGKSFIGRVSRGLHSMGFGGVAGAADSYEARRRARMINTAKKTEIEDLVSGTVHPLTDQEREAIVGEANLAELDKLAKSAESTRRMSGAADDEDGMIAEFGSLLNTLRENPDDRMAQANLIGVHNILSKSSGGRSGAINSMANFAANMRNRNETDNAGFRFAASQMLRSAGGVYKNNIPGGFQFLSDAANGKVDFDNNNFEEDSNTGRVMMRKYTLGKLGSFSGTSLIGADDYAFESLMDVASSIAQDQRIYNSLPPEAKNALDAQKATLDQITAAALNNPNIDGKVKDQNKLNAIRRTAGLGEIRSLYIPKQNRRRHKK